MGFREEVGGVEVEVSVSGLQLLGPGVSYRLTGGTVAHPENHYGAAAVLENIPLIAMDFYNTFQATLGINDISLERGGLFDIYGNWSPPHRSHRVGTSVDIDRCARSVVDPNISDTYCQNLGYPRGFVRVDRNILQRICARVGGRLIDEPTNHCEFSQ